LHDYCKSLDDFKSTAAAVLKVVLCKKKAFQAFTHLRSQIQMDCTLFAHDLPALEIAELSDVSRPTIGGGEF